MELEAIIKSRRTIRKYKKRDIPNSIIKKILGLSRYAPSSMDGQPWHFIVVKDRGLKSRIAEIKNKYCPIKKTSYKADFLINSRAVIVVCVDKEKSYDREIENGVLATALIILGASKEGIGSVYMSAYKDDELMVAQEIRELLGIPKNIDPITIIPLGYPDESPGPKKLRPLSGMVSYETFSAK